MFTLNKNLTLSAAIVGAFALSTSAFAGSVTEYSDSWKPGFSYQDGANHYERVIHVDRDTGYKSGSTRVTRTIISRDYFPGAEATEQGYERADVVFDPSQVVTASGSGSVMRHDSPLPDRFEEGSDN